MFELSVGSKVFLLGEYQVLQKEPALLVSLEPRFKLIVKQGSGVFNGFNQGSPAARYWDRESSFFKAWDIDFFDPHRSQGGFGASTAQVALLQGFKEGFDHFSAHSQFDFDLRNLHKMYLDVAHQSQGLQPSGADFISQFQGGFIEVDLGLSRIEKRSWTFSEKQILFFATGHKIATHDHLRQILDFSIEGLTRAYQKAREGLLIGDWSSFVDGFKLYRAELKKGGFEAEETTKWIEQIENLEGVLAAKGCGAMGADVLAIVVDRSMEVQVQDQIQKWGLRSVGTMDHRTGGFSWKWIPSSEYQC